MSTSWDFSRIKASIQNKFQLIQTLVIINNKKRFHRQWINLMK